MALISVNARRFARGERSPLPGGRHGSAGCRSGTGRREMPRRLALEILREICERYMFVFRATSAKRRTSRACSTISACATISGI
jgi:hypothetical protein